MTRSVEEMEVLSHAAYEQLAREYYTSAHPTSQAFAYAIDRFLAKHPPTLEPKNYYLDVGSGRTKFYQIDREQSSNLLLLDISRKMILHSDRRRDHRIVASAFRLPIINDKLTGVYSFLGDAYCTPAFFREVFRVLRSAGELLFIVPSHLWATTLRKELGIPQDLTVFVSEGAEILAPSATFPKECFEYELSRAKFRDTQTEDLFLPRDLPRNQLPRHILVPSQVLNVDPYELPILTMARGVK